MFECIFWAKSDRQVAYYTATKLWENYSNETDQIVALNACNTKINDINKQEWNIGSNKSVNKDKQSYFKSPNLSK